ncbi:phage baseplate plug family protein [Nicoliella lavandulae]|uniref:Cyanophage baseplate Pam3 plug gp18 domain-containing protein n=1 Tax=Nicoliella lavandulae TaxID=3082954 RepID=A0ABU8SMD5_9LACO
MVHDYIPVDIDAIMDGGYTQLIDLDSGTYEFAFYFNPINRVFYVDLHDEDGNDIKAGEPICLNQPLWRNVNKDKLPPETITPLDESGIATTIKPSNFGDTVQLCIDNIGDDSDD